MVAEVVFPNTVPPFFPTGALVARPPRPEELELRLAGIRAHNRWLAAWCAEHDARRAGIAQLFLNDVDEAIADVRFAHAHGLQEIDPIHRHDQWPVRCDLLRVDGGELVRAAHQIAAKNLRRHILLLRIRSFPPFSDQAADQGAGESRLVLRFVQVREQLVFLPHGRLDGHSLLPLETLAAIDGLLRAALLHLLEILQWGNRHTSARGL